MSLLNAPNPSLMAPGLIGAAWNGHWTWHVPAGSKALKPGPASHWASRPEHTTSASQQVPDKRPLAGARPLLIDDGMHTARGYPQNPSPRPADTRTSRSSRERKDARRRGARRGASYLPACSPPTAGSSPRSAPGSTAPRCSRSPWGRRPAREGWRCRLCRPGRLRGSEHAW